MGGTTIGVIKEDTRSLDNGSSSVETAQGLCMSAALDCTNLCFRSILYRSVFVFRNPYNEVYWEAYGQP